MASFQTFFRTVVMLATLGLMAKAWYLYGPSVNEMKVMGARLVEVSQQTWSEYWQNPAAGAIAADPNSPAAGLAPAPFVPQGVPIEPIPHAPASLTTPGGSGAVQLASGTPAGFAPATTEDPSTAWPASGALPITADAKISAILERLAQLGVRDRDLAPWGSRGNLMRFSCRVPWANSPAYSRHFEAVAATPLAAVEQVAAEIEAWQSGRR